MEPRIPRLPVGPDAPDEPDPARSDHGAVEESRSARGCRDGPSVSRRRCGPAAHPHPGVPRRGQTCRRGRHPAPLPLPTPRTAWAPRTTRSFPRMHEASAILAGGTLAAAREIASGPDPARGEHRRGNAPRDGRPGRRILRLQRRARSRSPGCSTTATTASPTSTSTPTTATGCRTPVLGDPRVLTISLHQHPATLWPDTGWSSEVGRGDGRGTAVNMPLLPGTVDSLVAAGVSRGRARSRSRRSARRSSSASAAPTATARTRSPTWR